MLAHQLLDQRDGRLVGIGRVDADQHEAHAVHRERGLQVETPVRRAPGGELLQARRGEPLSLHETPRSECPLRPHLVSQQPHVERRRGPERRHPSRRSPRAGAPELSREAQGCGGIRLIAPGPLGTRYELKHLYLRPQTRGRGWGRLLVEDLERRARAFGATELVLDTHHSLEAAGALYARSGYADVAPYNDNPNATRWYGKAL